MKNLNTKNKASIKLLEKNIQILKKELNKVNDLVNRADNVLQK